MALPNRTGNPLCHFLTADNIDFFIVPLNSEAVTAINAWFAVSGALTTVAWTQEAAGKGGYAQTAGEYLALKADNS